MCKPDMITPLSSSNHTTTRLPWGLIVAWSALGIRYRLPLLETAFEFLEARQQFASPEGGVLGVRDVERVHRAARAGLPPPR